MNDTLTVSDSWRYNIMQLRCHKNQDPSGAVGVDFSPRCPYGRMAREWTEEGLTPIGRYMLENSDVISFQLLILLRPHCGSTIFFTPKEHPACPEEADVIMRFTAVRQELGKR